MSAATSDHPTIAQATASLTISGRVTDNAGSAIPSAAITVVGGGRQYTTTTDNDGMYRLSVPPGIYNVLAAKGGFQTGENDGITLAAAPVVINITLSEQNLQSIRTIGRTSATGTAVNRTPFNISEAPVSQLPQQEIALRQNNNLTELVGNIPGVAATRSFSSTPNTNFAVRGLALQTRVTIDGHPVSSGVSGLWNTNYATSYIFQDAEVVKGAGLNGAIAGESAVGTVNLRTADFSAKNRFDLTGGYDQWNGTFYNALADVNFGTDNRFSLILQKSFVGYRGPWDNQYINRINTGAITTAGYGGLTPPNYTALDQWQGDYSNRYGLQGELVKLRYKFTETTSLTLEYLGLQGQYQPQGGSYGTFYGPTTIPVCQQSGNYIYSVQSCPATAQFSAPYTFNLAGQQVAGYTWFPNSFIQNNEPQFAGELRTSIGNDTALFRPYTHLINRYISGVRENNYPGNGGGWYAVTNIANCQAQFLAPGARGIVGGSGAAGPCFSAAMGPNDPSYIGGGQPVPGTVFATTPNAPNGGTCSTVAPYTCYTTKTNVQNDGLYGYGTPFSQPELDRLFGYTFTYIHPFGNNTLTFSYDYRQDFTQSGTGDQTAAAPGCNYVIGGVSGASVYNNQGALFQPTCSTSQYATNSPYVAFNQLPRSSISIPPTTSLYSDFSLNGFFQLTPALRFAFGNYVELYKVLAQVEDPNVLNQYAALGASGAAPVALIPRTSQTGHYDPHIGFEYRVDRDTSVRISGGSSITQPYPSVLSGFGSVTIPNAANNNTYQVSIPNPGLLPETSVSYDAGFDKRVGPAVISFDAYHINVHNVFLTQSQAITPPPQFAGANASQTTTTNGPEELSYGAELQIASTPRYGFGYYANASINRTYYNQLPLSLYAGNTSATNPNYNINGVQIFGDPFWKGYGQVSYNWTSGAAVNLGLEVQGQDNSTFGPPYALLNGAIKYPIWNGHAYFLLSGQNIAAQGYGATQLGRTLQNQGFVQPAVYLSNGNLVYAPPNSKTSSPLQALPPQTFRFSLNIGL